MVIRFVSGVHTVTGDRAKRMVECTVVTRKRDNSNDRSISGEQTHRSINRTSCNGESWLYWVKGQCGRL